MRKPTPETLEMEKHPSPKILGNFIGRGDTKGCTFTELKRQGDISLYLRQTPNGPTYEVIKVQRHKNDRYVAEKLIARAGDEFYPSAASFGKKGWYYPERPQADAKFAELTADSEPPVQLPDFVQPCDQCERGTPTKIMFMRQGLGNACACCGCLRRGKPYLSKGEFNTLKPSAAKGGSDDSTA